MASKKRSKGGFPLGFLLATLVLALLLCALWFWQPLLTWVCPELALTLALSNTASKLAARLDTPLVHTTQQCLDYVRDGSMDVELSLSGFLIESDYHITSASDPSARKQTSSFEISALGLHTSLTTYLDGDCAVFQSPLLGDQPYGITFQTFEEDLTAAGFDQSLTPENLALFREYVRELEAVYPSTRTRSVALAVSELDGPQWLQTMLAYLADLQFKGYNNSSVVLDGVRQTTDMIATHMDESEGAQMLLDALKTVSTNVMFASSLYSEGEDETPALQELLEYYRDYTEGDIALSAELYQGQLVVVRLEWNFAQNKGTEDIPDRLEVQLNLGADPATSDWTLTIQETQGSATDNRAYILAIDGSRYTLTVQTVQDNVSTETVTDLRWDEGSGLVTLDLTKTTGGTQLTASTSGTMLCTDNQVSIDIAGLGDILKLVTLPDFMQGADLGLMQGAHLTAKFQAEAVIETPDFVNLDQWELPWFLDLFL